MNELTTDTQKPLSSAASTDLQTPTAAQAFASLIEMAKDPNFDADKLKTLADLQLSMLDRQKEQEFMRDKVAAVREMPRITKRGAILNKNNVVQSRYSRWEDIHKVITPILFKYNLVLTHIIDEGQGGGVTVQPVLTHTNGYMEKGGKMPITLDTTGSKNSTQGAGSAATYGQRYTTVKFLNIREDGVDNDAQDNLPAPEPTNAQAALLGAGRAAAKAGIKAYEDWFVSQSRPDKLYLVESGEHDAFKKLAKDDSFPGDL